MSNIDFQPMPKRFMVWGKESQRFSKVFEGFWQVAMLADRSPLDNRRYVILQSTNLFDKDGKEIFEGSILELDGKIFYVYCCKQYAEFVLSDGKGLTYEDPLFALNSKVKVVGHILSNPELLEGTK